MPKKVALVDIDGCLVQDGKLNLALVEKLKQYDEVILFTQRSKFIQKKNANNWLMLDLHKGNNILITPDAADQLSALLGKNVKVSTSVDRFFGKPLAYYESELKPFEQNLKAALRGEVDEIDFSPIQAEVDKESPVLRELLRQGDDVSAGSFYPKDKVDQYVTLTGALPALLDTDEEIVIDFFDDHPENLQEIIDHKHLPIKPNCFIVAKQHISTLSSFNQHKSSAPNDTEAVARGAVTDTIASLRNYKKDRYDEWQQTGSEYKSNWAAIFKHQVGSARNKISAVDKAIQILSGVEEVKVSAAELKALKDGRVKELLGNSIDRIEEYMNEQHSHSKGLT
ncbi:hypothetical protein Lbir_2890 [Legionella birminghamensis]|uniref:Dot/Icm T4SS effector n=1 Tax=Legionella birminghamensis TaxID=28083 RepID=A0A378I751_9GAMM|nr:hypothetical protein [Legionella birminghamensis]KTC68288.1 hypothetical protein Lbir_2890 [Legionella birminghamensis]STX30999.1 Uncharacterised protein [Legionella birminghamensis]